MCDSRWMAIRGASGVQVFLFASYLGTYALIELGPVAKEKFIPQIYLTPVTANQQAGKEAKGLRWEKLQHDTRTVLPKRQTVHFICCYQRLTAWR